jgi:hypothetical protein
MAGNVNPISAQCKSLPITVTSTASSSTALPATGNTLRIVNEGPNVAFISVVPGTAVATLPNATPTATSFPVVVGDSSFSIFNDGTTALNISAICRASQTATLVVSVGEGV